MKQIFSLLKIQGALLHVECGIKLELLVVKIERY